MLVDPFVAPPVPVAALPVAALPFVLPPAVVATLPVVPPLVVGVPPLVVVTPLVMPLPVDAAPPVVLPPMVVVVAATSPVLATTQRPSHTQSGMLRRVSPSNAMRSMTLLIASCALLAACGNGIAEPIVSDLGEGGEGPGTEAGGPNADNSSSSGSDAGEQSYCSALEPWPEEDAALEERMLEELNDIRALGFSCDGLQLGEPLVQLTVQPALHCAARMHSRDMLERGFFDAINPDGEGPEDRAERAGAVYGQIAEVRGDARIGPVSFLTQLLSGGTECDTLLNAEFETVGIGSYDRLWTIVLATPP